jgi:hypothetical protein
MEANVEEPSALIQTLRRERDDALALLADVRLILQDPRLPPDAHTAKRRGVKTSWVDREERVARAITAELSEVVVPDADTAPIDEVTRYRNQVDGWLRGRRIAERVFEGVFGKTIDV